MTEMINLMKKRPKTNEKVKLGAESEMKSKKRFASLLSTNGVRVVESGTKDCRFTLSTLVRESGTF